MAGALGLGGDVMGQISAKLRSIATNRGSGVCFWCPGCKEMHAVTTEVGASHWSWDGNADAPTFSPSILVTSGHHSPGWEGPDCWCTYNAKHERKSPFSCKRCHSFVRAGQIQFLGDCTHALAGQTVPLPNLPGNSQDRGEPKQ